MNRESKLNKLLDCIDEIDSFPDGSIRIKWLANVAHEIPGHMLYITEGSIILKGHQVHLNPELEESLRSVTFEDLQAKLDQAVIDTTKTRMAEINDQGCGL